ncbi:hypothetical protein Nepgr_033842 [Nepenthes gracilis]|uniref:Uncharacterized protein n=1 Tax=Nepenthes gracilis TaxID=150966 RepID=A0AAD3TLD5_NEPGR|nr:hypothetical protein Nepgr_033842 [Nepenthes gracilis]
MPGCCWILQLLALLLVAEPLVVLFLRLLRWLKLLSELPSSDGFLRIELGLGCCLWPYWYAAGLLIERFSFSLPGEFPGLKSWPLAGILVVFPCCGPAGWHNVVSACSLQLGGAVLMPTGCDVLSANCSTD